MIIDAENQVLGRICTVAAKKALNGEKIDIVNAEKAIITGKKKDILAKYKRKQSMGVPKKGPFWPTHPDRFVRKTVRGMLPYKKPRGKDAYSRVKAYVGFPEDMKKDKVIQVEGSDVTKLSNLDFVRVGQICEQLGVYNE